MIQDIPAEESLLALLVADAALAIDENLTPFCFTEHRRDLAQLLGRIKMESGNPGYETLRSLGAGDETLKLWDVISHDDPPIESFKHLVKHLKTIACNRKLHEMCKKWNKKVMDGEFSVEDLDGLERQALSLRDLIDGRQKAGSTHRGGDVAGLVGMLQRMVENKGKLTGLRTGFNRMDSAFDGLCPGRLYLFGARPSVGKTSYMLSMANNLLDGFEDQPPTRGMIFTLEMPFLDIQMNQLVIKSRVSRDQMGNGPSRMQLEMLKRSIQEMSAWDYEIDDTGGIPIDQLCHRARRAHNEKPLQWLMVDYLQLVKGSRKSSGINRQVEIGEVSQGLKALAKELGIPVGALAQLKRQERILDRGKGEKVSPRPKLDDLRESGDLEQDADGAYFIHRDQEGQDKAAEGMILKNRFGRLEYTIPLVFEHELSKYREG